MSWTPTVHTGMSTVQNHYNYQVSWSLGFKPILKQVWRWVCFSKQLDTCQPRNYPKCSHMVTWLHCPRAASLHQMNASNNLLLKGFKNKTVVS